MKAAQKYEDAKRRVRTFNKPLEKYLVIENEEHESASLHDEMNTYGCFSDEEIKVIFYYHKIILRSYYTVK